MTRAARAFPRKPTVASYRRAVRRLRAAIRPAKRTVDRSIAQLQRTDAASARYRRGVRRTIDLLRHARTGYGALEDIVASGLRGRRNPGAVRRYDAAYRRFTKGCRDANRLLELGS